MLKLKKSQLHKKIKNYANKGYLEVLFYACHILSRVPGVTAHIPFCLSADPAETYECRNNHLSVHHADSLDLLLNNKVLLSAFFFVLNSLLVFQ